MPKIRILIVDDSVIVRRMVSNVLADHPQLEVVGVAANGRIALAKIPQINPDLIVLDVEMPEMDGLETLKEIRKTYLELPVIMFSAITELGANVTLDALALGANDYVTKPDRSGSKEAALNYIRQQLIPKIKVFCPPVLSSQKTIIQAPPVRSQPIALTQKIAVVAIGVSTGGPNALNLLLPQFPANFPIPILIVQHIPPVFSKRLADRLSSHSQIPVWEAKDGDKLEPGQAWIAPGDYHMEVKKDGAIARLHLQQNPQENSCRPAVDVLFRSVATAYQNGVLGIILTGMGQDGLNGCKHIKERGGRIFVQDEASSVVWGMPGIVAHAGLCDRILPLDRLAEEIIQTV